MEASGSDYVEAMGTQNQGSTWTEGDGEVTFDFTLTVATAVKV